MSNYIKNYSPFGLTDSFFDEFFNENKSNSVNQIMKTDIKDEGDHYLMQVDLPAVKKEDLHLSLNEGYLTIEASTHKETQDKNHHYLRKERSYGRLERSFYVGDSIKESDIKASLKDGVLTLFVKKPVEDKKEKSYIAIE